MGLFRDDNGLIDGGHELKGYGVSWFLLLRFFTA